MSGISALRGGWVVAVSIGAVEALKDQLGVCRWNYGLRCVHKHAKNTLQSYYGKYIVSDHKSSCSAGADDKMMNERENKISDRREKALEKVMDLSCWGPSTVRF